LIGKRLRLLREEKKLKQIDLAKILKTSSQALSQYELDKRTPDLEMLCEIANYFEVSLDYLVGRSNIKKTMCHSDFYDDELPDSIKEQVHNYIAFMKSEYYKNK